MKQRFTDYDSYLFREGTHTCVYRKLGAHLTVENGRRGTHFALWAPNAKSVAVLTDRTGWEEGKFNLLRGEGGVWEVFLPGIRKGDRYRYVVEGADGVIRYKADPYAFCGELRPGNASVVYPLAGHRWQDGAYWKKQDGKTARERPMAIYEVHLGSWKKDYGKNKDGFMNYRILADQLAEYLTYMGYTHVELMGICEYPLDASWGYQVSGYYAPTARYGSPEDFRCFVDKMHQAGIGVILDWVPAHFPKDSFGLARFDGTPLYEYADPLRAEYPEWGTYAFDHGKPEVQCFFISNALYWMNEFHVDALRVDAVAAMLYNSFSRTEWRPNALGGHENLESFAFFRHINRVLSQKSKGFLIAEDSSIIPKITAPVEEDGLGFGFKWNMGWMNETLRYVGKDPLFRGWHHSDITHPAGYAFLENYVLVLSHDEVVYGKRPLLKKFPGWPGDQFGGLKTLYTYFFTHPGKKLLFMGQDFAEDREWDQTRSIDWALADVPSHRDVMNTVRGLLSLYRTHACLYSDTMNPATFEWVNGQDAARNTISFIRRNPWNYEEALLVICNFSPMTYNNYTCGVPLGGWYQRLFDTYEGLAADTDGVPPMTAERRPCDGRPYTLTYDLRPYESAVFAFPTGQTRDED